MPVAVVAGSTFLYFLQPVIGGFCLAAAFLVSVIIDRPLARRFANDFGLPRHVASDRRFHQVFRRISLLWGVTGIANSAAGLWLLVTQSTNFYVLASTALSIGVPAAAVSASIVWFRRTVAQTSSKIGASRALTSRRPEPQRLARHDGVAQRCTTDLAGGVGARKAVDDHDDPRMLGPDQPGAT